MMLIVFMAVRIFPPQFSWINAPEDTVTFVIIMDDPGAGDFCHWILFEIASVTTALPEGIGNNAAAYGIEGLNDANQNGYDGPYPPGGTHTYSIRLYAIDVSFASVLNPVTATRDVVLAAMDGHILAEAEITGLHTGP